jgi:hypothetical protein
MLIKDLVHIDEHGAFRSDVQLSDYDNPTLNRELLQNYIFTVSAPSTSRAGRDVSAKDVLEMLKTAFTLERFENRIVLTANFGRGKSHLALTLANFFSRPAQSEEVRIIFDRLGQALNNPAALSGYREFKQGKGEFLVIRLRGDGFDDLQEGFLRALEQALNEHDCTRGLELPFWHAHAETWLDGLAEDARQKAEAFLSAHNTDLASLRQDVRKSGAYELIRETFKRLTGVYPDFGREVSLKDLVLWAVDEVCAPNKMGGLLVLFDEFSLFLQKYAASRAAGKLQDLLNGIADRQGKSAFLAFTQIELESVLDTYTQGARRDDVKKELDRLPQDKRARLFSLMEGVLDSYLKQDEAAWEAWLQRQPIRAAMSRNRETLTEYFSQRYDDTLRWSDDEKMKTVVKGCFPLHPLTTAILSNHTFEAGAGENPRTALHFVRDRWEKGLPQQPAERGDGNPNFVFAIELVDFFGKQISEKWYEAYQSALQNARIPLHEEHRAALKALLLQQAVSALDRKKASGSEQLELLSALSGLAKDRLKSGLREMSDNRVIEFNPYRKVSSLLPAGVRSLETDKIIEEAVQKTPIDRALLDEIAQSIPPLAVSQQFGHADDWAPRQVVLAEGFFTSETLKNLLLPYRAGLGGIEEGARGLVIWLLAQTEEEKMRLRQNAQKLLDEALGKSAHPLPVVIILPNQPNPGLLHAARRKKAVENLGRAEREKIGTIGYENERKRAKSDFELNFMKFVDPEHYADLPRQAHEYALPQPYRTSAETQKNASLKNVLSQIYRRAYAHRVNFYTQYAVGGKGPNKLREAVQKVTRGLFADAIASSLTTLGKQDIQAQVTKFYLAEQWGLLSVATYAIQPPTSPTLREAWNGLEAAFPPGCKETRARDILLELLNPPYGHDYNTLTLLLAAWIGFRRHEIRISLGGQLVSLESFKNYFDQTKSPKDFLDRLIVTNPLAISRINADEMFAEVDSILEQIRQNLPFSLPQAQQALANLEQALENSNLSPERHDAVVAFLPRLKEAIETAKEYDSHATAWLNDFAKGDVENLLALRPLLDKLTPSALVFSSQPAPDQLRKDWETRMERELEIFCKRNSQLSDLSDYKAHQAQLQKAQRSLKEYPALYSTVETALAALDQRRDELKRFESEKSIIAEIEGMAESAGLADLYRYQARLTEFKNLSAQTEKSRQQKRDKIENRIRQFEQLAQALSQSIESASTLDAVRQQKDYLLRNLDQAQGTPLYQSLNAIKEKIEQLEAFFEQMRELDRTPAHSPEELNTMESQINILEAKFVSWLSPAQVNLLTRKKQQLTETRQRKELEARRWLIDLANRHKAGSKPHELLRMAQNPPAFLPASDLEKLEQVKKSIQKAVEKDHLQKIESLFAELDPSARRECLRRLQEIVEKA